MLVGAAQIAIAAPLHAQERQVDFDIPAQELSKSLREFAAITDMDLLYPPQLVENRQARAVKGAMTPTAALREMLRGSGLAFDVNGDDAVTLRAVGASRTRSNLASLLSRRQPQPGRARGRGRSEFDGGNRSAERDRSQCGNRVGPARSERANCRNAPAHGDR